MRAPELYLVTDRTVVPGCDLMNAVTEALAGLPPGAAWVQLREADLPGRELVRLARALGAVCRDNDARLLVHDRLDVARAAGADGVHVGERGFDLAALRQAWPGGLIGASCHSAGDVVRAAAAGVNLAVLGPVFPTILLREYGRAPLGLKSIERARELTGSDRPLFAQGGIDAANVAQVMQAGATGVAVTRSIFADLAPRAAAACLAAAMRS